MKYSLAKWLLVGRVHETVQATVHADSSTEEQPLAVYLESINQSGASDLSSI